MKKLSQFVQTKTVVNLVIHRKIFLRIYFNHRIWKWIIMQNKIKFFSFFLKIFFSSCVWYCVLDAVQLVGELQLWEFALILLWSGVPTGLPGAPATKWLPDWGLRTESTVTLTGHSHSPGSSCSRFAPDTAKASDGGYEVSRDGKWSMYRVLCTCTVSS